MSTIIAAAHKGNYGGNVNREQEQFIEVFGAKILPALTTKLAPAMP
jgi:hypothetical protein